MCLNDTDENVTWKFIFSILVTLAINRINDLITGA